MILILPNGRHVQFKVKSCAELYQKLMGGKLVPVDK